MGRFFTNIRRVPRLWNFIVCIIDSSTPTYKSILFTDCENLNDKN